MAKNTRLKEFGLEALLRSDPELLPMLATTELLDELIDKQLGRKSVHYKKPVGEALTLLLPAAGATKKLEWMNWWRQNKDAHQPEVWQSREQPKATGSGTSAAAQRAFDRYQSGLDVMLCLDSTGSMQPTIDALAIAVGEMADILSGISRKLRVGLVHYKGNDGLGKHGAELVQSLPKNMKGIRKKLEKMRAIGGGDLPEAVLGGLDMALSKKMKWNADANKIAILIGDTPPHPDEKQQAIDVARAAFEKPGSQNDKKSTTGARKPEKPYLTSAIPGAAVRSALQGGDEGVRAHLLRIQRSGHDQVGRSISVLLRELSWRWRAVIACRYVGQHGRTILAASPVAQWPPRPVPACRHPRIARSRSVPDG